MKKRLLSLFLICGMLAVATSCGKEEMPVENPSASGSDTTHNSPTPAEMLLGEWVMDLDLSTNHEQTTTVDGTEVDDYTCAEEGLVACSYTFFENGTMTVYTSYGPAESYTDTMTYTLDGDTLTLGEDEVYSVALMNRQQLILDCEGTFSDPEANYYYRTHYIFNRKAAKSR